MTPGEGGGMTRARTIELAVKILGTIAVIAITGDVLVVIFTSHGAPVGLVAIASGCVGALATLVAAAVAGPSATHVAEEIVKVIPPVIEGIAPSAEPAPSDE